MYIYIYIYICIYIYIYVNVYIYIYNVYTHSLMNVAVTARTLHVHMGAIDATSRARAMCM